MIKQFLCNNCLIVFKRNEKLSSDCKECGAVNTEEINLDEYLLRKTVDQEGAIKFLKDCVFDLEIQFKYKCGCRSDWECGGCAIYRLHKKAFDFCGIKKPKCDKKQEVK